MKRAVTILILVGLLAGGALAVQPYLPVHWVTGKVLLNGAAQPNMLARGTKPWISQFFSIISTPPMPPRRAHRWHGDEPLFV